MNIDFWQIGLIFIMAVFGLVLFRLHQSDSTQFQFEHFFMDDQTGKASLKRLVAFGAWLVTSYIVLHQNHAGRLTSEVFGLYIAAWVFNYVAPALMDKYNQKATPVAPTKTEGA